jgi:hypothetical protein
MQAWIGYICGAILGLSLIAPAHAADDPPTEFSRQVTALTGDWEAEDWRRNVLMLHPSMYNDQSDVNLRLFAEEPSMGRTATAVLKGHFEGDDLGDDSTDPTILDLRLAKELAPNILTVRYRWTHGFSDIHGFWGVISTVNNSFVPFTARCEADDPDRPDAYRFTECVKKMATTLANVQTGLLRLPDAPNPLSIAGYDSQYLPDGTSFAVNSNYNGLRKATIMVTAPQIMTNDQMIKSIKTVSDSMIDSSNDQVDKNPGTIRAVGTDADPWLRREFPEAFDGPSIHMTGTAKTADGKTVIIGVRCPNKGWLQSCSYGVEQAKLQVRSGQLEARRQKIIAATQVPLPPNGLKNIQIFGIYTEGHNTMGYGGFMTGYSIDGPLLLKDGRATNDYDRAIAYIDPVVDARKKPGDWGRWTRAGSKINITWGDGDTDSIDVTGDNLMVGGPAGMKIAGYYKHVSGGGTGISGNGYLNSSSYSFFADGTFENDRSSSFSVGGFDSSGAQTTIASGGSSGGGGRGTYSVDGYTMTLTYPDGRISRVMIAVYAKDVANIKRSSIMLNSTVYFLDDD